MYPFNILFKIIINLIIITKCSEITNEELLDCLLSGIKYGSKCDFLSTLEKQKNEQKIKNEQKKVFVKLKVPHNSDYNSVTLNNAFYKPLYRVHKRVPETVVNNVNNVRSGVKYNGAHKVPNALHSFKKKKNSKGKQLKRQIRQFLGILNKKMNQKRIKSLLKDKKHYRSRDEDKPLNPPLIIFLNKGKGDFYGKKLSKVMLGPVIARYGEDDDTLPEGIRPIDFNIGNATEKPIHAYNFWNYWTYDKPVVHDRCPTPLVEFHGMCIANPPH